MHYDTGKHCVFHHRYHIVWSTKYRYKVLTGRVRLRVRDILRQVCRENEVDIPRGVLSSDHVHMFVSVPQKIAIPDPVRGMKGRSSRKVQREFPALRRRYWGRKARFGAGARCGPHQFCGPQLHTYSKSVIGSASKALE